MSFDMLGVMGRVIAPNLGLSNEVVFSGLTIMMVLSGLGSPITGRLLKRYGAARVLGASSIGFAIGLALLAVANDLYLYLLAWSVLGLAGALGLSAPAYAAVVEREGTHAKRTVTILMLFTGLSNTIFWPLLSFSNATIGWRMTFLACAAFQIFISLPLYLFVLPKPQSILAEGDASPEMAPIELSPAGRRRAFWLMAAATTISTFVTFGLAPSLIELFKQSGASPMLALQLGSARGALGISARFLDMLLGRRSSPIVSAIAGLLMLVASFLLMLFAGGSTPLLILFIILYGFGSGVMAVARALLPLAVFSRADYGQQAARLSLPQNLANAIAPVFFTALLDRHGAMPAVLFGGVMTATGLALILVLALQIKRARDSSFVACDSVSLELAK